MQFLQLIEKFPQTRLLVIGDIMMDEYIWGEVHRISPEAPVPIVEVQSESLRLGGAANVANNIWSLGGKVLLCGVVGDDFMGERLGELLKTIGIRNDGIFMEEGRPTTLKTRVIAHSQQIVRFDREVRKEVSEKVTRQILKFVEEHLSDIDAVVVSDYAKGVITRKLLKELIPLCKQRGKIIMVDPKIQPFIVYHGVTLLTPNHHEAGMAVNRKLKTEQDIVTAGRELIEQLDTEAILITRGKEGMSLIEKGNPQVFHISAMARTVYDVTGAGDTVISVLTLALAAGASFPDSALLSNLAAGLVVGKMGTATLTVEELKEAFSRFSFLT
jgi:D-beta-D-heptose 7-phosphate kinase/D-beta-D-heptose 1-phosphate adenosyltransferase